LVAGFLKLVRNNEQIVDSGGKWAEDFSENKVKLIGVIEFLSSIALLASLLLNLPNTVPMGASAALGVVMLGAAVVHIKRKEFGFVAFTLIVSSAAFFVSYYSSCINECFK